jgi:hypothetical protein
MNLSDIQQKINVVDDALAIYNTLANKLFSQENEVVNSVSTYDSSSLVELAIKRLLQEAIQNFCDNIVHNQEVEEWNALTEELKNNVLLSYKDYQIPQEQDDLKFLRAVTEDFLSQYIKDNEKNKDKALDLIYFFINNKVFTV